MNKRRWFFLIVFLIVTLAMGFLIGDELTLESLKMYHQKIVNYYANNSFTVALAFFVLFVVVICFAVPGATILSLGAGAIFGLWKGFFITSFANAVGATLAFLFARYLFRKQIEIRFKDQIQKLNKKISKQGALYLLGMRLMPFFPFFIFNMLMGVTRMKARTFFWVSQLGILPGAFIFVNAGLRLSHIRRVEDIVSPPIIVSLAALGIFPLAARWIAGIIQRQRTKAFSGGE